MVRMRGSVVRGSGGNTRDGDSAVLVIAPTWSGSTAELCRRTSAQRLRATKPLGFLRCISR